MTFIEEARRQQILAAAIDVLASFGFGGATFAQISAAAAISPALITYHFSTKDQLMAAVIAYALERRASAIEAALLDVSGFQNRLRALVEADVDYVARHPSEFRALTEVVFNRKAQSGATDLLSQGQIPTFTMLEDVLFQGARDGHLNEIDVHVLAVIIDGAKDRFLAAFTAGQELEPTSFVNALFALLSGTAIEMEH